MTSNGNDEIWNSYYIFCNILFYLLFLLIVITRQICLEAVIKTTGFIKFPQDIFRNTRKKLRFCSSFRRLCSIYCLIIFITSLIVLCLYELESLSIDNNINNNNIDNRHSDNDNNIINKLKIFLSILEVITQLSCSIFIIFLQVLNFS